VGTRGEARGRVSQPVGNAAGHDDAAALIEAIAGSRTVAGTDLGLVRLALQIKRRCGIAYRDAAVLVSEDFSHGQDYGGVRALNPFASG